MAKLTAEQRLEKIIYDSIVRWREDGLDHQGAVGILAFLEGYFAAK